jgi:hypothetical protein
MKKTSKRKLFFGVLLGAGLLPFCAIAADQRLDGVWSGIETVAQPFRPKPKIIQVRRVQIVIAQGGTLLAVTEGHCPGRYGNVRSVSKDTLAVQAGDCSLRLTLSPDGSALTEQGTARAAAKIRGTVPYGQVNRSVAEIVQVELNATLHRER